MIASYVSPQLENTIFVVGKILFVLSMSLNALAMGFLLKRTPPNQATVRNYLILIQLFTTMNDVVFEISLPVPLFPHTAGYCCGILASLGVSTIFQTGLIISSLLNVGVSIILCCLFRHQTILFDHSPFKLRKRTLLIVRILVFAFFNCGPISLVLLNPTDKATIDTLVERAGLSWMRDRTTAYLVETRSTTIVVCICIVNAVILSAALTLIVLFAHMHHVLNNERGRSSKSVAVVRKSLIVLFIQLAIPFSLMVIPGSIIFFGLAIPDSVAFEFSLPLFYICFLHSIGHNIILLSITPAYRKAIARISICSLSKARAAVATVSVDTIKHR